MFGEADDVFNLLIGHNAADEQEVRELVVEQPLQGRSPRRVDDAVHVDRNRQDGRFPEAQLHQFLPVVVGIAKGEIDLARKRGEVAPASRGEPEQFGIVRGEEPRGCDVVVLQHTAAAKPRERLGHRRRQSEVINRHVALTRIRFGKAPNLRAHVVVNGDGEDVRAVPHGPKRIALEAGAVADGVAPMCGRDPLVDDHG